jgi:hypothetical protein
MMVGALAGPVSFRMQCLYHDSYCAAILQPWRQPFRRLAKFGNPIHPFFEISD